MVLAIDVGNSSTTIGLFDGGGMLSFRSVLPTYKSNTQDQWAIQLTDVFRLYQAEISQITGTIVSSVVPPVTAALCGAVSFVTGKRPVQMGPGIKTGLNIKSDLHAQLGSDIVAFSVAALHQYPSPLVVIDMGTAITMSLLRDNVYEGCIIMPGVRVAVEALSQEAAELPHISIEPPSTFLGHNTVDAMRSGVVYGNASMVDGMLDRITQEVGVPLAAIVATGAAAPEILTQCRHNIIYNADLLLNGLYLIYQKSTAPKQRRV
ncbi:type III pantothenate kinase [Pseudoflavonifractor sp. 524-17]|nr:type III pantothenate kinase [Pseudoflavonifractor sp. 524-17]NCE64587.1 type III pantothenate kinase [Pseudoflavonifractor sp. 524-17]